MKTMYDIEIERKDNKGNTITETIMTGITELKTMQYWYNICDSLRKTMNIEIIRVATYEA